MINKLATTLAFAIAIQSSFSLLAPSAFSQSIVEQNVSAEDYLGVVDALHRFAWGMDTDDVSLIQSAFTQNGVADFSPAANKIGIQFPPLEGRDMIGKALGPFAAGLITSHTIGNVRISTQGDQAQMQALVEAQQIAVKDTSRHILLKNSYNVSLVKEGQTWKIKRMTIDNIWQNGDVKVLTGQ
jgi:hypothetical protein